MCKGIFWLIQENEEEYILSVKVQCDKFGETHEKAVYSSKSGDNFNHKVEWERLARKKTGCKPYNYFPRGRVEISKGKITVFCHPYLLQDKYVDMIAKEFDFSDTLLICHYKADNSHHYQALLYK